MINEFSAKKLGEVLAFSDVGLDTYKRGEKALTELFGTEEFSKIKSEVESHKESIKSIAEREGVIEVVLKKLESTGKKLREMRDLYIGEEWSNPTELLEWSGFFEGAAMVHWALVDGVAKTTNNSDLQSLSKKALDFHKELLYKAHQYLYKVGTQKSKD